MLLFFPFNFDIHLMALAVIALVVACAHREKSWASAVWLPVPLTAAQKCGWVVHVMEACNQDKHAGSFGAIIALLAGLPWFLILFTSFFGRPRTWALAPILAGFGLFPSISVVNYLLTTDSCSVEAFAPDGKPVSGVLFSYNAVRYQEKRPSRAYVTDNVGCFHFRSDPREEVTLNFTGNSSFEDHRIRIQGPCIDFNSYFPPTAFSRIEADWNPHQSAKYRVRRSAPIPVFLHRTDQPESPIFLNFLRDTIAPAKKGSSVDPESIRDLFNNPESFHLIPEIASIISDESTKCGEPALQGAAISGLVSMARWLAEIRHVEHELQHRTSRELEDSYAYYRSWADVSRATPLPEAKELIKNRSFQLADELIAASRPAWADGGIAVVEELGGLGSRALSQFQDFLPTATPRTRVRILHAIGRIAESIEDVQWAVSSNDPELVFAGYQAFTVHAYLTPQEHALAVERLDRIAQISHELHTEARSILNNLRVRPTSAR